MYNIVNTLYKELFQVFFFFFATKNGKTYIVAISLQVSLLECGGVGLFVVGQTQLKKKKHISQW